MGREVGKRTGRCLESNPPSDLQPSTLPLRYAPWRSLWITSTSYTHRSSLLFGRMHSVAFLIKPPLESVVEKLKSHFWESYAQYLCPSIPTVLSIEITRPVPWSDEVETWLYLMKRNDCFEHAQDGKWIFLDIATKYLLASGRTSL